ncbi:MAG TPA: heme-copper oxidase subunit III [Limnochordales bacterium]
MPTLTHPRTDVHERRDSSGEAGWEALNGRDGSVPPIDREQGGGGPGAEGGAYREATRTARVGAWVLVAAVTMLFVGFSSTYLVRRTGPGWVQGPMPPILYLNTAVLAASSLWLELARRAGLHGRVARLTRYLAGAWAAGLLFVVGQVVAWWQMAQQGLLPASGPHASFFYLLSGMHALHVLAGLVWLGIGWARSRRVLSYGPVQPTVESGAIFWHFMGVLWLYLWFLLFGA